MTSIHPKAISRKLARMTGKLVARTLNPSSISESIYDSFRDSLKGRLNLTSLWLFDFGRREGARDEQRRCRAAEAINSDTLR
jgi:hypothetical protein